MEAPKRVLAVGEISEALLDRLLEAGFEPQRVADKGSAIRHIERYGLPHLALLALDLPDGSAIDLCQYIHTLADVPIIILSDEDKPGLAAWALQYADDYVRLPAEPDEVAMRAQRILSRVANFGYASGPQEEICDALKVDYVRRCAIVDGEERRLTPTEAVLLSVLIKHTGVAVDAETLMARAWRAGAEISDRNALRVHMHRLRRKIERDPRHPTFIITERGIGYTFIGC